MNLRERLIRLRNRLHPLGATASSIRLLGAAANRRLHLRLPRLGRQPQPQPGHQPGTPLRAKRSEAERIDAVQTAIGIQFADRHMIRDALTHRSYLNETDESRPSNERLEFLGDSVLGLVATDYLFHKFPQLTEGELTNIRSALVRTEALAGYARDINLGANLFVGKGEELSRGRHRPSGLACAFESVIGAIYLDQGYDSSRDFILRFVRPALNDVLQLRLHKNGKSTLQEVIQARWQRTPTYYVIDEAGPDHEKSFTVEVRVGEEVLGRGIASNKRSAEQLAAQDALEALGAEA